ncbi:MAG: replication-associated recombination protein A [Saprospiraceae bacterium]|nr:replication-associated recombination protein A [Bacteroidia bacterium]NNK90372.1 replication-associated recombination protein A [Saprospiraceae bacterium]
MQPLAERLRPANFDEYLGQEELLGPNGALRKVLDSGHIPSRILWGPPGVGKTTLANIIANHSNRPFYMLSAINSGVKDVREAIKSAESKRFFDAKSPILFIDEIHRFSKSQQDALLGAVEKGTITLIGATTENPSFEVISALLSRCQVYILKTLSGEDLKKLLNHALQHDSILKEKEIRIEEYEALLKYSSGDGRKLLNLLEILVNSFPVNEAVIIDNKEVESRIQQNIALYDKAGESHYDIISAFIKSIRGSDPNAAVYYLARMVEGGEDPLFICRRMVISASEDIGLANPNALLIANNCFQAVHHIGMPEGRIVMSQCAIYLAQSAKSNSAYMAIKSAQGLVRETGNLSVPLHLRNAPTELMKELDYGKDYKYAHDHTSNFVDLEYLPDSISETKFYTPSDNLAEKRISDHLRSLWKAKYGY